MKKIFFHIGLAKTGTSYLQSTFAINSAKYKDHGLIYKDFENDFNRAKFGFTTSGNGKRIAKSLDNNLKSLKNIKPYILSDLFNSFDKNYDHLISSEFLGAASLDSLKNIFNIVGKNFKCIFIACVRNPVENVISSYLQNLKSFENEGESFDIRYSQFTIAIKKRFNLLIGLRQHIKLFNYDFKKHNLINCFDDLIFGKLISKAPEIKIINPSLNYQQSEVFRLMNKLNINFTADEKFKYIYGNNIDKKKTKKFPISKSICKEIYKNLSLEIREINTMLPDNEQIKPTCDDYGNTEFEPLFTNNDIDLFKRITRTTTSNEERLLFNKKLSPYSSSPELPVDFNVLDYLLLNPDVLRSNIDPVEHYLIDGKAENRQYNKEFKRSQTTNLNFDRSSPLDRRFRRIVKKYILKLKLFYVKLLLVFK
jgi:hypothetical protein